MGSSRKSASGEVLIKKYGNRRLYDTNQSRYITLDDLSGIVKEGAKIKVVEASTNRDLTRQVLTQVILEQQESLDMIPVELLHAIIRVRGTIEQAPFSAFLATVTKQFVDTGSIWARQWTTMFGGFPGDIARDAAGEPVESVPDASSEPAAAPDSPAESGNEPAPTDEIEGIRRRMDALLNKLGK